MKAYTLKRGGAFALAEILMVIAILAILAAFMIPQAAQAALQVQTDTNNLAVASTNTFILNQDITGSFTNGETPAGSAFIDATKTTQLFCAVGGFFTNTTAASSNVIFRIAQSVDNVNWTNNAASVTVIVPALSTNWAVTHFHFTAPYPLYGLRAVENVSAAGITARASSLYFKAWPKSGL